LVLLVLLFILLYQLQECIFHHFRIIITCTTSQGVK